MNYIWKIFLDGQSNRKLKQANVFSPYYELPPDCLDTSKNRADTVEFNCLFRFDSIFDRLFWSDMDNHRELRDNLIDILAHCLADTDTKRGILLTDLWKRVLLEQLVKGGYGQENARLFHNTTENFRDSILSYLLQQYRCGSSVSLFGSVVKDNFPETAIYKNKSESKEVIVYFRLSKTQLEMDKLSLINNLFLPVDRTVRIFWETHFGILGIQETMKTGFIQIF